MSNMENSSGPAVDRGLGCRKWLLIGVATAVVLGVLGIIGIMGFLWLSQKTSPLGLPPDPPGGGGSVPQWTSDGRSVLLSSDRRILKISLDTDRIEAVLEQSEGGYVGPSVSRTGRMAYLEYKEKTDWVYSGPLRRSVETSDIDGRGARRLQRVRFSVAPQISPDGSRVAYEEYEPSPQQSFATVIGVDGKDLRRIELPVPEAIEHIAWSPDSRRLALSSSNERGKSIWVLDVDGSDWHLVAQMVGSPGWLVTRMSDPAWAPDGSLFFFQRRSVVTGEDAAAAPWLLMRAEVGGDDPVPVVEFEAEFALGLQLVQVSPVGRHLLAYVSNEPGSISVYVVGIHDGVAVKIWEGRQGFASWSPDGARIAIYSRERYSDYNGLFISSPDGALLQTLQW